MRSSAGLSCRNPWAMHHFITAAMRRLTRRAVSGFVVPYGGETGHDMSALVI